VNFLAHEIYASGSNLRSPKRTQQTLVRAVRRVDRPSTRPIGHSGKLANYKPAEQLSPNRSYVFLRRRVGRSRKGIRFRILCTYPVPCQRSCSELARLFPPSPYIFRLSFGLLGHRLRDLNLNLIQRILPLFVRISIPYVPPRQGKQGQWHRHNPVHPKIA
jgi:hypothetical protein